MSLYNGTGLPHSAKLPVQARVACTAHSRDTSVLGIIWNLDNDVLKCYADLEPLACEVRITKRLILSVVQKISDPIGLLTPTTLLPKLLLQNLWKLKISRDHELQPNCKKELLWHGFKDTTSVL
ncbi:integrase catalytic domain-containing protein [Trichonephila clavipes]|nr:integrase catalytic domain-containing protein [Trichonephila clavipes]